MKIFYGHRYRAGPKQKFSRPDTIIEKLKPTSEPELDMDQVSIWDLLEAFDTIVRATGGSVDFSHIKDDTPIDLYQIEILHRLQTEGPMNFERIFEVKTKKIEMVGLFLALLELTRTNEAVTGDTIRKFIENLNISQEVKEELFKITPWNYTGL